MRFVGISVLALSASVLSGVAHAELHTISAYVDGQSQLVLKDGTVQWHHLQFSAPGRWGGAVEPTIIDGTNWFPQWPDVPNSDNINCGCASSIGQLLSPALPAAVYQASLTPLAGRGVVSISQQPSAANGYALVLNFDDVAPAGADWYQVQIEITRVQDLTLQLSTNFLQPSEVYCGTHQCYGDVFRKVTATAILTESGQSKGGERISLEVKPHDMLFGGHTHSGDPVAMAFVRSNQITLTDSCTTDADGKCPIVVTVPEASGEYEITVSSTSTKKGATFTLGFAGLGLLPISTTYDLVGARAEHGGDVLTNHYGSASLLNFIPALVSAYSTDKVWKGRPAPKLKVNDMSLPLGGMFDIDGNYDASHWLHRLGDSVDIDHAHADGTGVKEQLLEKLAKQLRYHKVKETPIHFERTR